MKSNIRIAFEKCKNEKRPALLTYTVAGDNTKKKSLEILNTIAPFVDIVEVGIPHNTPVADGGQIQSSAYRAIKNGIKIKDIFQIVKQFKKNQNTKKRLEIKLKEKAKILLSISLNVIWVSEKKFELMASNKNKNKLVI